MRAPKGSISVNINLPLTQDLADELAEELELDDEETRVGFIRKAIAKEIERRRQARNKPEAAE